MKRTSLWPNISEQLRTRLGGDEYEVWLATALASTTGDELRLAFPSQVYVDYVRDHYLPLIEQLTAQISGSAMRVTLVPSDQPAAPEAPAKAGLILGSRGARIARRHPIASWSANTGRLPTRPFLACKA